VETNVMGRANARDSVTHVEVEPPRDIRYKHHLRLIRAVGALWRSRELVLTLAERDLRVRYKQTILGAAWAVLLPFALMIVFTLFLQRVAKFDTQGVPYPLFSYVGLIVWGFFTSSVTTGGQSLVLNGSLLNKVACPREVFPIAGLLVAGFDMGVSVAVLGLLFVIEQFVPKGTAAWIPILLLIQVSITLAVVLVVSSSLVYVRDLRQALPVLLQLGLFATPVAYGMNLIPAQFRVAYSFLNPLAPVIDGYRQTILFGSPPDSTLTAAGAAGASLFLILGYVLFKRLEVGFADVA
jgi:ABC-2 type transport system permease protein/lipopolysaccharide transport system permease protein